MYFKNDSFSGYVQIITICRINRINNEKRMFVFTVILAKTDKVQCKNKLTKRCRHSQ